MCAGATGTTFGDIVLAMTRPRKTKEQICFRLENMCAIYTWGKLAAIREVVEEAITSWGENVLPSWRHVFDIDDDVLGKPPNSPLSVEESDDEPYNAADGDNDDVISRLSDENESDDYVEVVPDPVPPAHEPPVGAEATPSQGTATPAVGGDMTPMPPAVPTMSSPRPDRPFTTDEATTPPPQRPAGKRARICQEPTSDDETAKGDSQPWQGGAVRRRYLGSGPTQCGVSTSQGGAARVKGGLRWLGSWTSQ